MTDSDTNDEAAVNILLIQDAGAPPAQTSGLTPAWRAPRPKSSTQSTAPAQPLAYAINAIYVRRFASP
jgi:hypothetical protein